MSTPGFDRQTQPEKGKPYGWIQWQGTDVCMDVHCPCGYIGHAEGRFAFYVRCPSCLNTFSVSGFVEFIPLNEEETKKAEALACGVTDA